MKRTAISPPAADRLSEDQLKRKGHDDGTAIGIRSLLDLRNTDVRRVFRGDIMINLRSLSDWRILGEGDVLKLRKQKSRMVAIEVNAPYTTVMMYIEEGMEPKFLARVEGLQTVRFTAPGPIDIAVDQEVQYRTSDNMHLHAEQSPEKYTKIMARGPQDPVQTMMRGMQMAFEKRLQQSEQRTLMVLEENQRLAAAAIGTDEEEELIEDDEYFEPDDDEDDDEPEGDRVDEEEPKPAAKPRKRAAPKARAGARRRPRSKPGRSPGGRPRNAKS